MLMTLQHTLGDYVLRDNAHNGTWVDPSYNAVTWHSVRSYEPTKTAVDQFGNLYTVWENTSTGQRCAIPKDCDKWRECVKKQYHPD